MSKSECRMNDEAQMIKPEIRHSLLPGVRLAQLREVVPGIEAGRVVVGPDDFDGVVADEVHTFGMDVIRDSRDIKYPLAGDFVNACRTGTILANDTKRQPIGLFGRPDEFEDFLVAQGANVLRGVNHGGFQLDAPLVPPGVRDFFPVFFEIEVRAVV